MMADRRCSTHFIVGTTSEVTKFMACLFASRLEQPDAQASEGGEGAGGSPRRLDVVTEAAEDFAMMTGMEPAEFAGQVDADKLLEHCGGSLERAVGMFMEDKARCRELAPPRDAAVAMGRAAATAATFHAALTEPWSVLSNEPGMIVVPPAVAATRVTLREIYGGCICCTQVMGGKLLFCVFTWGSSSFTRRLPDFVPVF